jgi:putative chitinase
MIPVNGDIMFKIAPRFSGDKAERQADIINQVGKVLQDTLEKFEITTRLRIAHFLAQTCHESAGFRTTEEFASGAAYEGRADLGNVKPGDGPRYKGRGLLQLTGRANYKRYGELLGIDLEGNPESAADPQLSLLIACEYWKLREINDRCDRDDIEAITRRVNGGLNGLEDRKNYLRKAKAALAAIEGAEIAVAPGARPHSVLRRESQGAEVTVLQHMLRDLDFAVAVDGDFGPGTEVAVARFQSDHGLTADGVVGPQTWDALEAAVKPAAGTGTGG